MNVKDVLVAQLNANLENTWFVALLNSIEGLTEEQAQWKPDDTAHSISEIVNHLIFYNQRYLNRFNNVPNPKNEDSNTFKNRDGMNWNDKVKRIYDIMAEWKNTVEEAEPINLEKMVAEIAHLTLHTTYHTGQIIYIRKLQDNWDSKDGVSG
ncbi:DinB family protein [Tenuibacillus multivorans]|uniref:DinB superfamily protein n=1 Tax=Tenuibacillus multivorans TaxID=237069 RepID=A0A1H0A2S2_9BACI|nr:DinB family protein [Tenuibacillus multivorans]GEL78357.1 hypothetical protein TMU01_25920 [Tenuibacillus multivorans]SDN27263.1 DinB superfamily protein [Tenuibacillus multivorans]